MILFKKKEKKDMVFLSKKRFRIPVVPLLLPGHLRSKHPPNIRSEVLINVGLLESNEEGDIFPKRGSRIPVKVGKQYTADEVLKTALNKHADNDQFFCSLEDYVLCYPDQKLVDFVPGATESFTVEKYKEEFLSKPYSKD